MDRHGDSGLRIFGVLAGIGAMLPVGFLALLAIQSLPVGYFAGGAIRIPLPLGVMFSGVTLALFIATLAVADGQTWGALAIALYGAAMALFIYLTDRRDPYATGSDAAIIAFHVAVGVLALTVAFGLARGHLTRGAAAEGPR